MSDQATLNNAARVISAVTPQTPADSTLRQYFAQHRYVGPREKRLISKSVFAYYRWLQWLDHKASLQKQIEHAAELQTRFNTDPKSIKTEALNARAIPVWLREEMDIPAGYAASLQQEPALWLRARPGTAYKLADALGNCTPAQLPPALAALQAEHAHQLACALRFKGMQDLFRSEEFKTGAFEIQDLSSQIVGMIANPQPGETWWDTCAGEGGKTLHLADMMQNKGLIWSTDRSERRIETLKRRAGRAKLFNYRTAFWDGSAKLPTKIKFDGILIDAPCSGVGTWQRNPHARWTTQRNDVAELTLIQTDLLNHAAGSVKPGGRLVYSVCTLTRAESTGVAATFAAAHPEFEAESAVTLWPHEVGANGMFIAVWKKKK